MNNNIIFFGGGGQCKLMSEIWNGGISAIIDDVLDVDFIELENLKCPVFKSADQNKIITMTGANYFSVTVGNPNAQFRIKKSLELMQRLLPASIIHSKADISPSVSLGLGVQISKHVSIGPCVRIREWCIINSNANIEHDCFLYNGVEIGPSATLCGNVEVGEYSWIGAGSVIRQRIKIGTNSIIGCGSVVVKDVPDNSIYVGNPAKFLKGNK